MRPAFYDTPGYKSKQAELTRKHWQNGTFNFRKKQPEIRNCENIGCSSTFQVKPYKSKKYCSQSCAASISNLGRILSSETKKKIATSVSTSPSYQRYIKSEMPRKLRKQRVSLTCQNPKCRKIFSLVPHVAKRQKFCSNLCSIRLVGSRTTSPKAAKSKPGIRIDIDPNICFYSTWEANVARAFNLIGIKWEYAPRIFDLGEHTYRPDFYLPKEDIFIEVKNFMGEYSLKRDQLFRKKYPTVKLEILGKTEYNTIKEQYSSLIDEWE